MVLLRTFAVFRPKNDTNAPNAHYSVDGATVSLSSASAAAATSSPLGLTGDACTLEDALLALRAILASRASSKAFLNSCAPDRIIQNQLRNRFNSIKRKLTLRIFEPHGEAFASWLTLESNKQLFVNEGNESQVLQEKNKDGIVHNQKMLEVIENLNKIWFWK